MAENESQNTGAEMGEGVQVSDIPTDNPPVTVVEPQEMPMDDKAAGIPTDLVGNYGVEAVNTDAEGPSLETETACIGGILVASCVELAQASQNCTEELIDCEEENAFAVAVGTISLFLCICYVICLLFKRDFISKFTQYLSLFLLIWWTVGVIVLTFKHPFNTTGNGYFACWGALLLSIYYCQLAVEKLKVFGDRISNAISGSQLRKLIMLLMFLSYVEAFASLVLWDEVGGGSTDKQSKQEVWIFCCGIISGALTMIYLLLEIFRPGMIKKQCSKYFSWFLVVWWMFGAGVATFDEPFPTTGNGYFCAWGAFVTSVYLAYITTVTVSM